MYETFPYKCENVEENTILKTLFVFKSTQVKFMPFVPYNKKVKAVYMIIIRMIKKIISEIK